MVAYNEEFLMHPVHDDVVITLTRNEIEDSTLETYTMGQVGFVFLTRLPLFFTKHSLYNEP